MKKVLIMIMLLLATIHLSSPSNAHAWNNKNIYAVCTCYKSSFAGKTLDNWWDTSCTFYKSKKNRKRIDGFGIITAFDNGDFINADGTRFDINYWMEDNESLNKYECREYKEEFHKLYYKCKRID